MRALAATLTSKGQITIPKEVRQLKGRKPVSIEEMDAAVRRSFAKHR